MLKPEAAELRSIKEWHALGFVPKAGEQPRSIRYHHGSQSRAKLFDGSQVRAIRRRIGDTGTESPLLTFTGCWHGMPKFPPWLQRLNNAPT